MMDANIAFQMTKIVRKEKDRKKTIWQKIESEIMANIYQGRQTCHIDVVSNGEVSKEEIISTMTSLGYRVNEHTYAIPKYFGKDKPLVYTSELYISW